MKKRINAKRLMAVCCIMLLLCSTLMLSGCEVFTGNQEKDKQINTLEELNGNPVYAVMGTSNAADLLECEKLKDSEVLFATGDNDAAQKLITGKTSAFVTDNIFANTIVAKYESLKVLDEPISVSSLGFAFQKDDELQNTFNASIVKFKENGIIDEIHDKWFATDISEVKVPEQNYKGKNGTLKVAVDPSYEPICFLDAEGNLQGFDIELLIEIARDNGYNLKFVQKEFGEILPNVAAGNVDLGASGITITEDRSSFVDFSTPYFSNSTVVVVRDTSVDDAGEAAKMTIGSACYKVFVENEHYNLLLKGFGMSALFTVISIITANIFGFLLYLWVYSGCWFARAVCLRIRRFIQLIPGMIWLYIVFYLVFVGSTEDGFIASLVAFTIMFGNVAYGVWGLGFGEISEGQKEAAYAMGYGKYKALFKIYLPQAWPVFLENVNIEMVGLVKSTALVELVSVFDIQAASDTILNETAVPFIPILLPAIAYVIIAVAVSKVITMMEVNAKKRIEDPELVDKKILKG